VPRSRKRKPSKRRGKAETLLGTLTSESFQKAVIVALVFAILLLLSGVTYSFTARNPVSIVFLPGGGIRVFLWSMSAQTHAETMVILLYYMLGAGGLWLYVNAATKPFNPRSTKYMLFFSFLLLLLSGLGLYNAYVAKYISP